MDLISSSQYYGKCGCYHHESQFAVKMLLVNSHKEKVNHFETDCSTMCLDEQSSDGVEFPLMIQIICIISIIIENAYIAVQDKDWMVLL